MHISKEYHQRDPDKILEFIRSFPLGTLISFNGEEIEMTHLPFVIIPGDKLVLETHMAIVNPHWESLNGKKVKILFRGPSAYISPTWYSRKQAVPTWNYIAVEASGVVSLIKDNEDKMNMLTGMVSTFESSWMKKWEELKNDYGVHHLPAIVGLQVEITHLQCQEKLSQDKPIQDQQNIIEKLKKSDDKSASELGDWIEKRLTLNL